MSKRKCTGSFSFIVSAEWDYVSKGLKNKYLKDRYSISMTERLSLERAAKMLIDNHWEPYHCLEDITARNWDKKKGFNPENKAGKRDQTKDWLYGEFLYFTNKVRPLVYNLCDAKDSDEAFLKNLKEKKPASVILERKIAPEEENQKNHTKEENQKNHTNRYLLLRRWDDGSFTLYSLPLSSIQLRLYASGVMTLSICCNHEINAGKNNIRKMGIEKEKLKYLSTDEMRKALPVSLDKWDQTTASDIAWIRDAGRRLFWPYGCIKGAYYPSEAPAYSALQLGEESIILCDYRAILDAGKTYITKPEYFDWTQKLICDHCVTRMKMKGDKEILPPGNLLVIQYFNDDRMYLHNTIVSPEYSTLVKEGWAHRQEITNANKNTPELQAAWEKLRVWYAILAADKNWHDATCQDADMLIRKCEEATDARWMDSGTFYGLYYNSITQLINSDDYSSLSRNMDWMYYQLFLLAIMQRSSIQRFYREASGAAVHRATNKAGKLSDALKEKYAFFMNIMWFTEATEQEQGCDFFGMMQENMGLNQDMSLLKDAIEELSDVTEKNLENAVNNALLPATFIGLALSAFDGLSHLFGSQVEEEVSLNAFSLPFPWALTTISCGIALALWIYYFLRKR